MSFDQLSWQPDKVLVGVIELASHPGGTTILMLHVNESCVAQTLT